MLLNELFDDTYPTTIQKKTERAGAMWLATFSPSDGRTFHIEVNPAEDDGAVIAFFEVKDGDEVWAATGAGDAYRVFATVMDVMRKYAVENDPTFIGFSAENSEPVRVALYKRMVRTLCPKGYHLELVDAGRMTDFFVYRDDAKG